MNRDSGLTCPFSFQKMLTSAESRLKDGITPHSCLDESKRYPYNIESPIITRTKGVQSMKQQTMSMYAEKGPITDELLGRMDAWFRAANYLSAGQLYLL